MAMRDFQPAKLYLSERGIKIMRKYRCKVKTIKYVEVTVYAKNKDEAKRKAPNFCEGIWGNTITSQTEILDVEHILKTK